MSQWSEVSFNRLRCLCDFSPHTYSTGDASFKVLSTSKPPNFHSPLGEVNIEDGRKLPCVLAPDVFMNRRAVCRSIKVRYTLAVIFYVAVTTYHYPAQSPNLPFFTLARLLTFCTDTRRQGRHSFRDYINCSFCFMSINEPKHIWMS